eukprot:2958454-Amphidinium_carterae.1
MPMYLKVPVTHRVRRFQLGKLKIILKELQDEEEAALKDAEEKEEVHHAKVTPTPSLPLLHITTESTEDPLEVGSTAAGLSPRNLDDVPEDDNDDAAQLVASQSSEGSALSASAAIASAAQRKLKGQKQSTPILPSSMPTVPEEAAPPSEPGSYRSAAEEAEAVEDEQSEPLPPQDE